MMLIFIPADDTYGGIPPQIFYCRNLRTLCLNYQAIKFITDKIGQLRKLKQLLLNNCPMLESISGNVGKGHLKGNSKSKLPLVCVQKHYAAILPIFNHILLS